MTVTDIDQDRVAKNDLEMAREIEADMRIALIAPMEVLQRARSAGLHADFAIGLDNFGRYSIQKISIVKPLV